MEEFAVAEFFFTWLTFGNSVVIDLAVGNTQLNIVAYFQYCASSSPLSYTVASVTVAVSSAMCLAWDSARATHAAKTIVGVFVTNLHLQKKPKPVGP